MNAYNIPCLLTHKLGCASILWKGVPCKGIMLLLYIGSKGTDRHEQSCTAQACVVQSLMSKPQQLFICSTLLILMKKRDWISR